MKKTEIFVVGNITSAFSADIRYNIKDPDTKKLYEDTMDTLTNSGFRNVVFNVDSTIRIHPYEDYATTYSILNNDKSSEDDKLSFYWKGGYGKYFDYDVNTFINHSYEELSKLKITVTNIKIAYIEYKVEDKDKFNETYIKAIEDIKKNLFKGKGFGFIILRDHYNIFVKSKYSFLSVDYDEKNNKFTVKCDSKEFAKYAEEQLYYTFTLKIPQKVIDKQKGKGYILQYKKEDLEKIVIEIRSKTGLTDDNIKNIINDNLDKRNISICHNVYLFDKNSNSVYTSGNSVVGRDNGYTFYSDYLFIKKDYKDKSDELKAELNKIDNILSNIPASDVVNITDINKRKILIDALLKGMKDIIDSCVKYSADNVVNDDEYNCTVGKEFIGCDHFKKKMKNSFDYLANLYIFLSSIIDAENVIEKIKTNDIKFEESNTIFNPLDVSVGNYIINLAKIYKDKVENLFKGKNLWEKYSEKLTDDLNNCNIFEKNKYNEVFSEIYCKKEEQIKYAAIDYKEKNYKTLQVKIYNEHRIKLLGNYDLRDDNKYTYSLRVRPDLSSLVTFEILKKNNSDFRNLCDECTYLFTIYDKNDKYIGYGLDTNIKEDYVTFNPTINYDLSSCGNCYEGGLDKFNKMREEFKNREIEEINKFTGKAAEFSNKYATVLKPTEYLTLSDKMCEMGKEKEPYYLQRFREYLIGEKDIDGNKVKSSDKFFYRFSDYNILIINGINNAAIKKHNELKKAEMAEKDKETLSELETAVENCKNGILAVINSSNDLEKIKNYSNKEKIKVELEKIVKDKVKDYDTKKAKIEKIDLFTNPLDEIEKVYKTKENTIAEEKLKQQKLQIKPDPSDKEEYEKGGKDEKDKPTGEDNIPNPKNVQNTTNETDSSDEQQPTEPKSKKCCNCNCNCKKDAQ